MDRCPTCGALYGLVGYRHRCVEKVTLPRIEKVTAAVVKRSRQQAVDLSSPVQVRPAVPGKRGGARPGAGRKCYGGRAMTSAEKQAAYRARKLVAEEALRQAAVTRDVGADPGLKKTPTMSAMGADAISDQ